MGRRNPPPSPAAAILDASIRTSNGRAVMGEGSGSGPAFARLRVTSAILDGHSAPRRGSSKKWPSSWSAIFLAAYLVLKLIPGLNEALSSLERVRWQWVVAALALETLSETGFVLSWCSIVDPEDVLSRRGWRRGEWPHAPPGHSWEGGTLVPGGSPGGYGRRRVDPAPLWNAHQSHCRAPVQPELSEHRRGCARGDPFRPWALRLASFTGERHLTLTLLPALLAARLQLHCS